MALLHSVSGVPNAIFERRAGRGIRADCDQRWIPEKRPGIQRPRDTSRRDRRGVGVPDRVILHHPRAFDFWRSASTSPPARSRRLETRYWAASMRRLKAFLAGIRRLFTGGNKAA